MRLDYSVQTLQTHPEREGLKLWWSFSIKAASGQQGATRAANGSTGQRRYLIEGVPLGHGLREACSTVSIRGAKELAFRQLHLDLNRQLCHRTYSDHESLGLFLNANFVNKQEGTKSGAARYL